MLQYTRRSVLAALAATGFFGTSGASAATAGSSMSTTESSVTTQSSSDGSIIGVEVIDLTTRNRTFYESIEQVSAEKLSAGQYEIIEVMEASGRIESRTSSHTVGTQESEPTVSDGIDLRVLTETETRYGYVGPDSSAKVWVGAVEREDGIDRSPAANIELDVQLENSEGEIIETTTATTTEDGNATVEFEFDDAEIDTYEVTVESENTASTDWFDVGPYISAPFHWTGMTVGEETTIGMFSAVDGTPESGVTREITVDGPDDIVETADIEFEEGGIGMVPFTPELPGQYWFSSEESSESGNSIGSGELKALAPYFEIRNQFVDDSNETMTWGAHIVDDQEPVPNRDLKVTVREYRGGDEIVDEFTPTTNEFGQFTIELEKPEDTDPSYLVDITTADEQSVFLFGDRIRFDELPEAGSPGEPDDVVLDASFDDFRLAPGMETAVDVSLFEDQDPVEGATVTLLFSYSFRGVPAGVVTVETGSDGTTTHSFEVPEDAPDGERLYVNAVTELDDEVHTASDSATMEQYDIDIETWRLERGETNTLDVSARDRATGEAASGIDITVFGNRYNVDAETFDADHITTNEAGEGDIELTVPEDVTNDVMINELTPYSSTSRSGGSIVQPFSADVTVSPDQPSPGDSITVEYTTNADQSVSALAAFPSREGASVQILAEDEQTTFEIPEYVDSGGSERVQLLMIGEDGEVATDSERLPIADELTADFEFTPLEPTEGETITFEETSSAGPDAPIESYEWDFTGDGSIDETGPEVTHVFDEPGEYDVTLIVTDEDGNEETAMERIDVQSDDDEHESGVPQEVWDAVTDQNSPNDELTFQDNVDAIQAYQDDETIDGVEITFENLVDLIEWYQE